MITKTIILSGFIFLYFRVNFNQVHSINEVYQESYTKNKQIDIQERFVGAWKFVESIPEGTDHSMDGIICQLDKYRNTKSTFVFHLFIGNDLILSVKNDKTLIGENANLNVKFDDKKNRLLLILSNKKTLIFKKLK